MMAEQKGRGGKKPKYQIADIGGSDLTSQDLSTERVLNFLIKGEAPADPGAGNASDGPEQSGQSREQTATEPVEKPAAPSLPSSASQGKKSLDHLFRRASAGGGAIKDLKLELRGQDEPALASLAVEIGTTEQAQPAPTAVQTEGEPDLITRRAELTATEERSASAASQAPPTGEPETRPQTADSPLVTAEVLTPTPADSADLTQLISLWKSFYRLKDGEIEVLIVMYRMSHGSGSDECYVKMQRLAEMSNLTYRYCQKMTRSLEQLGWITKIKDYDPTTQLGVLYRINLKPSA